MSKRERLSFTYKGTPRTEHEDLSYTDGSPVRDRKGRTVGALITAGTVVVDLDPKGVYGSGDIDGPGEYVHVRVQATHTGTKGTRTGGAEIKFFKSELGADRYVGDELLRIERDPNPLASSMTPYNFRARGDQIQLLKQQPNASKLTRDALDLVLTTDPDRKAQMDWLSKQPDAPKLLSDALAMWIKYMSPSQ